MWTVWGNIYLQTNESYEEVLLADFDGDMREQTWTYYMPEDGDNDYFYARWPESIIRRLLEADQVTYTVPTSGEPYIVTFDVAGLDQHINAPNDLCTGP